MRFCKMRQNSHVELQHWLHQILEQQSSDLHSIIRVFDLDAGKIAAQLTKSLDALPRGASSVSGVSLQIDDLIKYAWTWATLCFGDSRVRTGYLMVAALKQPDIRVVLTDISQELARVSADRLIDEFRSIAAGSPEGSVPTDGTQLADGQASGSGGGDMAPAAMGKQEGLARFTVDLTERARSGKLDPVVGRDDEIRQMVDILMRRRQNNPILTGEAGVGKTAVVEGFARRIASGDVPPSLKGVSLRALDLGLLQAGASMKGEFEQRLRQVIDEVQASTTPIILFVDEVHTLVGAGGAAGTGDAANLLKPALARGTLRTIGATTWSEYKKYIEKDPALTRRFQTVKIEEPEEPKALLMMRGVVSVMEQHHRVQILDEALEAAVKLSHRYIPDRQLPDKSISLLDTACARVAVSHHATPAAVEDSQRRIEASKIELDIIGRERAIGIDVTEREQKAQAALTKETARLAVLTAAWQREKGLVDEILAIRAKLRDATGRADASTATPSLAMSAAEQDAARARLKTLQAELTTAQGDNPLVLPSVDEQAVASVVADWTGIPVGRMVKDEIGAVLTLAKTLGERVIGQDHGLEMIAKRVQTARAGLENPNKPLGVFMLAGPSGVGKTETALTLAEALYGGEQNLITINMSEFQEAHTVSTLKGAPPGYVGYGEGGVLTEAVRRKPYSVVLLDEVEKAHADVHEIFFQVFDKGMMEDGEGRLIDFKNTMIILTTNVGTDLIMGMCKDPELMPDPEGIAKALRAPMLKVFPAALLGRIVTIPYYPLSDDMMKRIIRLQLDRVVRRMASGQGIELTYTPSVVDQIAARCQEPESGGRVIDAILTNSLLPSISRELLDRLSKGAKISRIALDSVNSDFQYIFA